MKRPKLTNALWLGVILVLAGHLVSPAIGQSARYMTNLISLADTSRPLSFNGGTQGVRTGNDTDPGTPYTQIKTYKQTLGPTAITRTTALVSSGVLASVTQTFTVTGLTTSDQVFISGPAPTKACPHTGFAQASAANTLRVTFAYLTGLTCTPASGLYTITAFRTLP